MLDELPTRRITAALRFLATEARISQEKLATRAGMSQSAVGRRLHGDTAITLEDLDTLAGALGYDVSITLTAKTAVLAA